MFVDGQLAQRGMTVLLTARDLEKVNLLAQQLQSEGLKALAFQFDVTSDESAAQLAKLGLKSLSDQLSKQAGRPVNFMIFGSIEDAASKAPSGMVR